MGLEGRTLMKHPGSSAKYRNVIMYTLPANELKMLRRPKGFFKALYYRGRQPVVMFSSVVFAYFTFRYSLDSWNRQLLRKDMADYAKDE